MHPVELEEFHFLNREEWENQYQVSKYAGRLDKDHESQILTDIFNESELQRADTAGSSIAERRTLAKDGTESGLTCGQMHAYIGGHHWWHLSARDQPGRSARGFGPVRGQKPPGHHPLNQTHESSTERESLQIREPGGRKPGQALTGAPPYILPY